MDAVDVKDSRKEWTVETWIEAEPASIGEDAGCVTLLGWRAVDSTKNSVA